MQHHSGRSIRISISRLLNRMAPQGVMPCRYPRSTAMLVKPACRVVLVFPNPTEGLCAVIDRAYSYPVVLRTTSIILGLKRIFQAATLPFTATFLKFLSDLNSLLPLLKILCYVRFAITRESGVNPELSRSGKQERTPYQCTGSQEPAWEATASRNVEFACKSEDLSMAGVNRRISLEPSRRRARCNICQVDPSAFQFPFL